MGAPEEPVITITESARKKILELMKSRARERLALRVAIRGRGPGGFQYEFGLTGEEEKGAEDIEIDADGFKVFVDPESAPKLKGATLDFLHGLQESGFTIENPNPLWTEPRALAVQEIIDTQINPGVAMHGGHVTLLDVKDDVVYIALGGGCQGCGMVDVTLKQGIEVRIREMVPEILEIVDTTDHAGGSNPFYKPSKGQGPSPYS